MSFPEDCSICTNTFEKQDLTHDPSVSQKTLESPSKKLKTMEAAPVPEVTPTVTEEAITMEIEAGTEVRVVHGKVVHLVKVTDSDTVGTVKEVTNLAFDTFADIQCVEPHLTCPL